KQIAYNKANGIDPQPLRKKINDIVAQIAREEIDTDHLLATGYRQGAGEIAAMPLMPSLGGELAKTASGQAAPAPTDRPAAQLAAQIEEMTERTRAAAAELQFEVAARLRDEVHEMKKELHQMQESDLA
ncbi:excinuclease ABC subunit B, partial [Streptomyces sp. NPDC003703]